MKILVTGATGFIGQHLIQYLMNYDFHITIATRNKSKLFPSNVRQITIQGIDFNTNWSMALKNVECVIHLAGRAHVLNENDNDQLTEFRKVNTAGTINLAHQAKNLGIKRFIFISSIGVNGNLSNTPFKAYDIPNPMEYYAISKYEAEINLKKITKDSEMEIVVIRPPLVYGPDAPGNFGRLFKIINKGVPLPLGSIHNQRSFVAVENIIDLVRVCITHPKAANQTFLVSDGEDLSTTDLLRRMTKALGKPSRLVPIPSIFLISGLTLLGKKEIAQRLCGSLQVDISHTRQTLNWKPPINVDQALQKTANAYFNQLKNNN